MEGQGKKKGKGGGGGQQQQQQQQQGGGGKKPKQKQQPPGDGGQQNPQQGSSQIHVGGGDRPQSQPGHQGGQGKGAWKKQKQQQQQEQKQPLPEQQQSSQPEQAQQQQQPSSRPQTPQQPDESQQEQKPEQKKLTYKEKQQLRQQQQQQQQQGQPQPSSGPVEQQAPPGQVQQPGQGKQAYKQKQQQRVQKQQQEQPQSSSGAGGQQVPPGQGPHQQQGKQSYQQKQQQPQQQQQPQYQQQRQQQQQQQFQRPAQSHEPSPHSSHSSSPAHAAALEPIVESFSQIKIDKQKIHSSQLLPVLMRGNTQGTRGRPILIEVNYIQLLLDRIIPKAYHYDVDITPPASRKWQRLAFAEFTRQLFPNHGFAFDGNKNAYTARRLKTDEYKQDVQVRADGRERKFTVKMKEAAVLDMSCLRTYMNSNNTLDKPMAAIQCLDIVLRTAYENNDNFIKFKKSIYVIPDRPEDVGENHELWYGLFQSALLGAKPFLNIDVSHKAFPSGGPILQFLSSINRGQVPDRLPEWMADKLNTYLRGMEVSYTGPDGVSKLFKYNGIKGPASQQRFKLDDQSVITVEEYFRQKNKRLRYPNLPVIHVGSLVRNVMLPIELCTVPPGQALTKKHPDSCTQHIIKRSATDTATRKRKIMDLFNKIGYNNAPTIREFGVSVGNAFEQVGARIIDPPKLVYRNETVQPNKGVWRVERGSFVVPSTDVVRRPLKWIIVNLDERTRNDAVETFGRYIYQMSQKQGVLLEQFAMAHNYYEPRNFRDCVKNLETTFYELKQKGMDLVFVVIPNPGRDGDVYAKVKQKAELTVGLLTQCVKSFTLDRKKGDMSVISNIWLKINAKTNGSNHRLDPSIKPPMSRKAVMYIGADVTHPSPEQKDIPSVVGVAASYDLEGFRYNCCYRLQNAKDEMIRDLENIVEKQLKQFHQQNKQLPDLIMYYRDGVSEGQFAEILTIELRAIHAAAGKLQGGTYKPNITFIVVQKRHHARFFPTAKCPTEGRNNNVPPGTIVDRDITAPNQYQFFLVSHAAVQGVAKPTKYCVLYDDEKCNPDQLQALTYNLCHMFTRCNRAVSYPAPTYYAHLAAYRGRVYIKDRRLNMDNLTDEYRRMEIRTEIIDGHPMFFV